ncbi:DUF819 family protein [Sphingobacterium phlebotomi]|uniref:DUF819 family protein n=1 Tax=Sphingobacterium phlebotomi TaxID=2605433 RepID=A0A5D4GTN8_9SPHI|nr:DUF819 family protein [Sphingobacterium phlebotomi]TYR32241.1 DUF819 family protein [Sphingobacterium phlebotomi]
MPLIQNDAVVLAILLLILALVTKTAVSNRPLFRNFYKYVPPLLLCYFIPGILNTLNVISGENSGVYTIASKYLLPSSLILIIMSVDLKQIWKLRHKAGLMFLATAIGVILGGPLAIMITDAFAPGVIVKGMGEDASWRGLATLAASWTGGSANMAAMYEVFKPSPDLYSGMIAIDVLLANVWLGMMLYLVNKKEKINKLLKAEDNLDRTLEHIGNSNSDMTRKMPSMPDLFVILFLGLGGTGLAHLITSHIVPYIETNAPSLKQFNLDSEFLWVILITTSIGVLLSFTKARNYEKQGAPIIGNTFLYILIASIGMQMNILRAFDNPGLIFVCVIWLLFMAVVIIVTARIFKVNFFFVSVASEANVGGVPTASAVATAFSPSLVPVAVLLSVLGYSIGNYAGYICGILMQLVSQ